ncbi:hypothetical protein [Gymnodinialimonas sp.]
MRISLFVAALALAAPVYAQSVQLGGDTAFNPLEVATFDTSVPYVLDQAFADTHGVPLPSPFQVALPGHDGLHVQSIPAPSSGATVVFVFSQDAPLAQDRAFLEDLQITRFNLPMYEDAADPIHERRVFAAGQLETQIFPQFASSFEGAEIFAIEAVELGNSSGALQLVAGYFDQQNGDNMMLRAVVLPHPDRPEGYLAIANINLDLIPVTDPQTLAATATGRVLSSWQFQ